MSLIAKSIDQLLSEVNTNTESVNFGEVINTIDTHYHFTPTRFTNGDTVNEANSNNGSCKIFSFAQLHKLTEEQTLNLFGKYYREDVLKTPEGADHANIRNFMTGGWKKLSFEQTALKIKI